MSGEVSGETPPRDVLGYETEDVDIRRTGWIVAGLALTVALVVGGLGALLHGLTRWEREAVPPLTRQQTAPLTPPAPNLQPAPFADIATYDRTQKESLSGYAFVDAARTRARIPIDRAMALTVGTRLDP